MSVLRITSILALGSFALAQREIHLSNPDLANFTVLDQTFNSILGMNASIELIFNSTEPLFHEGGVYNATGDVLYVSS